MARFPNDQQRIVILGATGSGKTQAACYQLSCRDFDLKPWIIIDFKIDELINSIEGLQELSLDGEIPTRPGLYVVHLDPDDTIALSHFFTRCWEHENVGIYIDEGFMVGKYNSGFRRCLTQGRSKHIPMIILSQRPVWLDGFAFSESDFFQVFRLQWAKDIAKVEEFVPYNLSKRLPPFHSYYYDVSADNIVIMQPVPDREAILDTFNVKLERIKKVV